MNTLREVPVARRSCLTAGRIEITAPNGRPVGLAERMKPRAGDITGWAVYRCGADRATLLTHVYTPAQARRIGPAFDRTTALVLTPAQFRAYLCTTFNATEA